MNTELTDALSDGLTVSELIEALEDLPPDLKVTFAYDYGDYGRSKVAHVVDSVEQGRVRYSAYHQMPKVVYDDDDDYDNEDVSAEVVVLNLST